MHRRGRTPWMMPVARQMLWLRRPVFSLVNAQTINVYSINPVVPSYEGKGGGTMAAVSSSVPIATARCSSAYRSISSGR